MEELIGEQAKEIPGLAITDSQNLFSAIHNLKGVENRRTIADVINIKQAIYDDKTIQELRYDQGKNNIADCLTKVTKSGEGLLEIIRSGVYNIPGGSTLRDSTKISVGTWQELITAEKEASKEDKE